ncbi:hypothetical protein K450DRAFT_223218 [Umbelopsis ramanniana AG]|uniref:Glycosyl transferase family 1 domain-containing protein n=1 Tax=Umbelopsis ramanniana AG TaxID=1314678 RepID=A0AAD5HIJ8_UMBRA|nr:uncharacterized protein K450DRAFT_223218 [Umbelopsis ramanniana AG]KAI8583353.1 hypothetical protein K450DRAFT_223218 [Umbelopsis ramanniana AG]
MPPNPEIPIHTNRRFSITALPQGIYLGLDISHNTGDHTYNFAVSVHDGSYSSDYYTDTLPLNQKLPYKERIADAENRLIEVIANFARGNHYKVQSVGVSLQVNDADSRELLFSPPSITSKLWFELDAIPFIMETNGRDIDERASSAVRKSVIWLSPQYPGNLPRISVGHRHVVEVDLNDQIHMVDLENYQNTVCDETWRVISELANEVKDRKLRVSFFNSTPQGGGVALMRHALIRFLRLMGIDANWYVARPKPEIFDITKRKFHNVLQGVADPKVRLTDADKEAFIEWSNENVNRFWGDRSGPLQNSDVIIIDDPQVCGIIPHIKRLAPQTTRIIFRSHIEIRADLIRDNPDGPQACTWNFIWQFIKQADLFISHPVDNFIPDEVPRRNVVLLPAVTDPLDGLNKELNANNLRYYRSVFNRVCMDQGSNEVDWSRPYIVQVARFDPSKGIPDVLESYRLLRMRMDSDDRFSDEDIPQLVICGHGSIDDPDGTIVYEQTYGTMVTEPFSQISSDIVVARIPPSDQLLNIILRGGYVALQLSHREGFEVKVTEALAKGVPIIAYQAGGIPLQIIEGVTGNLVPIGDVQAVADKLFILFEQPEVRQRLAEGAVKYLTEEYFTVWNAIAWLFMCNEITRNTTDSAGLVGEEATRDRNGGLGDSKWLRTFWQEKYNYKGRKHAKDVQL